MTADILDPPLLDGKQRDRLRWQCRRGLRELDELLQPFLKQHLYTMETGELQSFRQLLCCPDLDLLNYLMQNKQPADSGWIALIEKIRSCAAD